MTQFRAVVTDLDGTIIPHGGTVSTTTLHTLTQLEALGIPVIFATGRPPRWLTPVVEATGHRGHIISANGALTLDIGRGLTLDIQPVLAEHVTEVADRLRHHIPDVALGVETSRDLRVEDHYFAARGERTDEGLAPARPLTSDIITAPRIEDLIDDSPFIKMIAISPSMSPDHILRIGREYLLEWVDVTHSSKGVAMLEMSARGVSKASALSRLTTSWGIEPSQVIAFGDMPNDVDMLRWAGASYAMSDGHPEALAAADHVAPAAADDGVAQTLREVFNLTVG